MTSSCRSSQLVSRPACTISSRSSGAMERMSIAGVEVVVSHPGLLLVLEAASLSCLRLQVA